MSGTGFERLVKHPENAQKNPFIDFKILKNLVYPVIWRSLERFKQGSLILYGSRANGTNDDKSDWDLLLIGDDIDAREVNSEVQRIEKETGASVNVMISTRKDIESIRERRNTFYLELLRSHHILRGDFDLFRNQRGDHENP